MISAPGSGNTSKLPYGVRRTEVRVKSVASAGRYRNKESAFVSKPVVMLKGAPDCAMISGKNPIPHFDSNEPVRVNRCRTSNDDRPNSFCRSYEFDGNDPAPSVSPSALPNV